ncbi:MAG: NUDIX hydrolase [Culicoidibacterales bacterium]
MEPLYQQIIRYQPIDEQEVCDQQIILQYLADEGEKVLYREQLQAHITASAWITNHRHDKVLMIYHNLYNSWAWTGGHADGNGDLLTVAMKEACEETGLTQVKPLEPTIFSLEVLAVNHHYKKGKFVPAHVHLNVTYLLEADEREGLKIAPDENSNVAWMTLTQAVSASSEPCMQLIYEKLNRKLQALK